MATLELSFESGEDSLSVRRFVVKEAISSLFEVSVEARSPNEDLDLAAIVGRSAQISVAGGRSPSGEARRWAGVCCHLEQVRVEASGLSTYHLRIVPRLWLLTQRRNHRLFQHLSIPEIADKLLAEWRIEPTWKIDRAQHPKLELRTQAGESDYAFLSRLLEEAGISFYFAADDQRKDMRLVLHEKPQSEDARGGGPIPYVDNPNQGLDREYVTNVRLAHDVRPGRIGIRDVDFRRNPEVPVFGHASSAHAVEELLEEYHYLPGSFLVEGGSRGDTPVSDDKGVARHDDKAGQALAVRSLEAARALKRVVSFKTSVLDLWPGVLFTLGQHPRQDLGPDRRLLVIELSVEGTSEGEWRVDGRAVFADQPYRPAKRTAKPQIHSVQSALVVGPKGDDIHTDEFGRVRVQFPWDREGGHDDRSSCWVRVSQGWAGSGFGMIAIPRIGQEVLVGFLGGDPDQPVVVGRLFNNTARVPYKLPENKAVSGWKSDSTPGSGGFNEIRFEDGKGRELLHVQAERNLTKLVKVDETEITGVNRVIQVGKRLVLTNGEASIVLDGPHVSIEAKGQIFIDAGPAEVAEPEAPEKEEGDDDDAVDEHGRQHYAPGIDVMGSAEFRVRAREALDRLAATRTGSGLFRRMEKTGRTATIVETGEKNGFCKAESLSDASKGADGRPGKGCASTVSFNPDFKPGGEPSEAVLAYALAHARMNALGMREPGVTGGVKDADAVAIGVHPFPEGVATENSLRRDLKLPKREHY